MTSIVQRPWTEFFSRERSRLIGYVRSLINDAADWDSEDILEDVITRIFDSPDITAPIQNIAAYVYQAIRNRVVDYMRRRKKNESLDATDPENDNHAPSNILSDLRYDVARQSEQKEIARDLNAAINKLDEDDKAVFIATQFQGFTFQELSDMWDTPIGTLLSRKSRAMKKLQQELIKIDSAHYSKLLEKG
jgi:RNA polymerase sigma factor (sigma-70 family)